VLVAGLSTGHIIGLAAMAAIFIAFALISSFVAPRKWPDFPGKGLSVYIVVCFVLFALMIGAVELFAVEEEEAQGAEVAGEVQGEGTQGTVIEVGETEWRIELPSGTAKTLAGGEYTFIAENEGKQPHNLVVDGPEVDNVRTKTIPPGGHAELHVKLGTGNYKLYCSIPGHEQLGMVAHLAVG
jgi:plastocyanin